MNPFAAIVALLTQLCRAIAAYYEVRAVGERWRLAREIQTYTNDQEARLAALRSSTVDLDQRAADRLRAQLVSLQGIASVDRLSAPDSGPGAGPTRPD